MTGMNKLSRKVSNLVCMALRLTKKKADQKKLLHHIIDLNRKHSTEEIIRQSADCLNEILNYNVFAFAITTGSHVDVWLDPLASGTILTPIILKDFNLSDQQYLNLHNLGTCSKRCQNKLNPENLISCETRVGNHMAKIYIIPGNTLSSDHDEIADLVFQSCSFAILRQMNMDTLSNAAIIDPLTGCYNRREFENQLKRNISGSARHRNDLSIFMMDLDHFKRVNDIYGHLAGDEVLKQVVCLVRNDMRKGDVFARYGGEEFIAILPETGKIKAMELAERLRIKISNTDMLYNGKKIKITASFGVATLGQDCADMKQFIKKADSMLYKAKLKGRNMVMPGLMRIIDPVHGSKQKQRIGV